MLAIKNGNAELTKFIFEKALGINTLVEVCQSVVFLGCYGRLMALLLTNGANPNMLTQRFSLHYLAKVMNIFKIDCLLQQSGAIE